MDTTSNFSGNGKDKANKESANQPTPVTDEPITYLFRTYEDRDRLFEQYLLVRDDFNKLFDDAVRLGRLDKRRKWRILDVGCGEGLFSDEIVSRYPKAQVIGFDRDWEAVATANRTFGPRGDLHFFTHDALDPIPEFPVPTAGKNQRSKESFDVVIAWLVLMHIRDAKKALLNIVEVLKPGGIICLSDTTHNWISFPHPSVKMLADLIEEAMNRVSAIDFANQHIELLQEAGFTDITSSVRRYIVGGDSREGQSMLRLILVSFQGLRERLVNNLQLISNDDFDSHIERIKSEVSNNMVGYTYTLRTTARKSL